MKLGLDFLQWPAMGVTLLAAWLVASSSERRRAIGFWVFLLSNALWIVWGWHDGAHGLITMQLGLAAMNIRGVRRNEVTGDAPAPATPDASPHRRPPA